MKLRAGPHSCLQKYKDHRDLAGCRGQRVASSENKGIDLQAANYVNPRAGDKVGEVMLGKNKVNIKKWAEFEKQC